MTHNLIERIMPRRYRSWSFISHLDDGKPIPEPSCLREGQEPEVDRDELARRVRVKKQETQNLLDTCTKSRTGRLTQSHRKP